MCNVSVGLPTLGVVQKLADREKTLQNGYLQNEHLHGGMVTCCVNRH